MAGIIDSESYFRIQKKDNWLQCGIDFCLGMTDRAPVEWVVKRYGATFQIENRGPDLKTMYYARLGKYNILPLINDMLPYLNEKYQQALKIKTYLSLSKQDQKTFAQATRDDFLSTRYTGSVRFFSIRYLAGIIDGDGWISLYNSERDGVTVSIGLEQCFHPLPKYLSELYGGGFSVNKPAKIQHRQTASWRIGHHETLRLLNDLKSYLILKKDRALYVLSLFEAIDKLEQQKQNLKSKAVEEYRLLDPKISAIN